MPKARKLLCIAAAKWRRSQLAVAQHHYRQKNQEFKDFIEKERVRNVKKMDNWKCELKLKEIELELAHIEIDKLKVKCEWLHAKLAEAETQLTLIENCAFHTQLSLSPQINNEIPQKIMTCAKTLKHITGLTREAFDDLLVHIAEPYNGLTLAGKERQRKRENKESNISKTLLLTLF